ncbi:hypothetical protein L1987_32709 [Smallanthus sonchifolius]|uniref:Uncharacterized protein n=1 Tax=Smallanthus sonchifolius TaxID=185202 RepID=A0ACB9HNS1_9ASTR|nr:hypothetical protein L1987_32709 [Smallanthus sonchifolius]
MSTPPSPPSLNEGDFPTIPSPEPKRRRVEPRDEPVEFGESSHARSGRNWDWYPGLLYKWVREEQVPSPYFGSSSSSGPHLPLLPCHLEQAFAAVVATMGREIRKMRETTGKVTGLEDKGKQVDYKMSILATEMSTTDHLHNELVDEVRELQARVGMLEGRVGELEAQLAAALEPEEDPEEDPEEEPEEEPEEADDDAESVISSAGSTV